jgi:polyferredoxin
MKRIVVQMPTFTAKSFLEEPYNKVSDVKMLLLFTNLGGFALKFIIVIFILSLFFRNFWCCFLCPYGALIGLGSIFRITKIERNEETCTNCEMVYQGLSTMIKGTQSGDCKFSKLFRLYVLCGGLPRQRHAEHDGCS